MPELPEVETVKRQISSLEGEYIQKAELLWSNTCPSLPPALFNKTLKNRRIGSISRRGKFLIIDLSDLYLVAHFRMTGTFLLTESAEQMPSHTRALFQFSGGRFLYFNDPRKFGRLWVTPDLDSVLGDLGLEPFDSAFTPALLQQMFGQSRKPIKSLLLTQNKVCGIGNMYADEALFLSAILPYTSAADLSDEQYRRLHQGILLALQSGIDCQGATVSDYHTPDGSKGLAQEYFFVAHRYRQPCKKCASPIIRTVISGRGTYYCPSCQR
jgi:formamidopyrimidine-DNA glycosylase